VPWSEALRGLLVPQVKWDSAFLTTLVAILGTTISPYLFIWQSAQEAEQQRIDPDKKPLKANPADKDEEFTRIRIDTLVGMAFSNIIAIAIIITTAATLHASGKTNIETSAQAAEALRPLAGGSRGADLRARHHRNRPSCYPGAGGLDRLRNWRRPQMAGRAVAQAKAGHRLYSVLAISVVIGIGLNFTPLDPIKALYWSAVVNGVLAPPVMALMMLLVRKKKVMGELQVEGWLYWLGWLATAAMLLSIAGMAVSMIYGGG